MVKPLISYYGGKQRIASRIVEHIRQIPHTVYVEPFAGGLAVLYAKGLPSVTNSHDYSEVINDHDERLITLYRVARQQPELLQQWLELTPYSQAEYRTAIEWLRNPEQHTEIELAWAYFVNINCSFANGLDKGWAASVTSRNQAATWTQRIARLPDAMARLQNVHIGCEDAIRFIERWDSPHTLVYADPPYPNTSQGHYDGYPMDDLARLCNALDNCQSSYILSNYPQSIEPQSAQQRIEINAVMSARKVQLRDKLKMASPPLVLPAPQGKSHFIERKANQEVNFRVSLSWLGNPFLGGGVFHGYTTRLLKLKSRI